MERDRPPYAIVAKVAFGRYVRTMRLPESLVAHAVAHEWTVLIRDSEMPPHVPDPIWSPASGSNRRAWLNERDVPSLDDEGQSPDDRYGA